MAEYAALMSDSAASMRDVSLPGTTQPDAEAAAAQRAAWWRQRLALDERMAALLHTLDHDWLGPWRYV